MYSRDHKALKAVFSALAIAVAVLDWPNAPVRFWLAGRPTFRRPLRSRPGRCALARFRLARRHRSIPNRQARVRTHGT